MFLEVCPREVVEEAINDSVSNNRKFCKIIGDTYGLGAEILTATDAERKYFIVGIRRNGRINLGVSKRCTYAKTGDKFDWRKGFMIALSRALKEEHETDKSQAVA